jgi:hypothetical protein
LYRQALREPHAKISTRLDRSNCVDRAIQHSGERLLLRQPGLTARTDGEVRRRRRLETGAQRVRRQSG